MTLIMVLPLPQTLTVPYQAMDQGLGSVLFGALLSLI